MTHPADSQTLPLFGFTVLDLSGTVGTATCGKLMADFGARVLNVEPPGGHRTRLLEPFFPGDSSLERSGIHALLSPGKESLVLDLSTEDGRAGLLQWLPGADVVLEAEQPGALGSLGLGFEELKPWSLELTLCSLTWWGQDGPMAQRPANDAAIRAETGQVFVNGPVEGPPILPSGYQVQVLGGVTAFVAVLEALTARVLGNLRGPAHVDVSHYEASLCLAETGVTAAAAMPVRSRRLGVNRFAPTFPMGIYPTREGWLGVSVLTPAQWHSFCDLLGITDIADLPEYQLTLGRLADADAIEAEMRPALLMRTAREWFEEGQARRIPLALVPTMEDLLKSEQMRARGSFRSISHPTHRELTVPAAPFRLHGTPAITNGSVARLGEHGPAPKPRVRPASLRAPRQPGGLKFGRTERPRLLDGIRVLDLSMGWAGPLAARHLADAGAEVIKIESRRHFDWWRGWEATPESLAVHAHEKANAFNIMNRNKFGMTLDLGSPRGNELFRELVSISDVVLENYSAGVLPKLGLDWPVLSAINPRLVMLSMPPFGAGGPWHGYRAYGSTVEQASGLPHLQGGPADPPIMQHVALGDPVAGVHGAAALITAVLHQQRTGQGQFLDLSQVEAVTHLGLHGVAHQLVLGEPPARTGNRHPAHAPQGVYRAAGDDAWLMLTVDSDEAWKRLVECLDCDGLRDSRFASADGRQEFHDEIDREIEAWASARPRDESVAVLQSAGVIAAPVLPAREVLDHPQLVARGFWSTHERPFVGAIPHPAAPYRFTTEPAAIDGVAPTLGQHTRYVLQSLLELDDDELDALERESVIGEEPELPAPASVR